MAQLDALRLSEKVSQRLVEFASYDRWVRDPQLAAVCRRLWSGPSAGGGLVSDLWVEGAFPAEVSEWSLGDLVNAKEFSEDLGHHLDQNGAVPWNRALYRHQHSSLVHALTPGPQGERGALVVTAPTGAGKTESFLLPVLDDLYRHVDDGKAGVKCILLYPMNALVNDQMDRLHGWLKGQSRVRVFNFTSETPEDFKRANNDNVPPWDASRVRTRQQARGLEDEHGRRLGLEERGRVPDIIITNYSMLEYMLCRPQDAVFFGPALRSIVLDEAHLYTGTLAAEITLLLRRLLERCGVPSNDVLQMATSATIGTGSAQELRSFASQLFTKDESLVQVVQGQPTRVSLKSAVPPAKIPTPELLVQQDWLGRPLVEADGAGRLSLAEDAELCSNLRQRLELVVATETVRAVPATEQRPAVLLKETLAAAPLIHSLESELWQHRHLSLRALADRLWNRTDETALRATVTLLQLGASARLGAAEYPLVPHRIHMLVRPTDGLYVCLNSDCSGPTELKLDGLGVVGTGVKDRCPHCLSAVLAIHRCDHCGEWVLSGAPDKQRRMRPAPWPHPHNEYFRISQNDAPGLTLNPVNGKRVGASAPGVKLAPVKGCPTCESDRAELRPFAAGTPLTLAVLAETALAEMPPYPSDGNLFLPAQGRRMLAFSDSRQEAARLGPRLTRQHEIQVIRSAFLSCLQENAAANPQNAAEIRDMIDFIQAKIANPATPDSATQMWRQKLQEHNQQLNAMNAGGSVAAWAKLMSQMHIMGELMHADSAGKHSPATWNQRQWEGNQQRVRLRAGTMLAEEFARRSSPLEKFGMVEVTYPSIEELQAPPEVLALCERSESRRQLALRWPDMLRALCDTLRAEGVINLGEGEENLVSHGSVLTGRWCAEEQEMGNAMTRFVGKTKESKRRRFAQWVLLACGVEPAAAEEVAPEVVRFAFRQLQERAIPLGHPSGAEHLPWLERSHHQSKEGPPAEAIRLRFAELGLRHPAELYRCTTSGNIWPRSVLACAPEAGANGTLVPVSELDLASDPRIGPQRKELAESPVFRMGLWAEEHSAQLAPRENRRLQDLFKAGIRNILSATTTLELGIDIGGLHAVLMSNVPPGKANYLQRAGRAGRRADGSSLVLTFARSRPFDQAVFQYFREYLDRPLRRPIVFLDRVRLSRRHLHSFLLGEFFGAIYSKDRQTGTMNAFGNMGYFSGVPLPDRWKDQVKKPEASLPGLFGLEEPLGLPWWNPALKSPGLEAQFLSFLYWLRDWGEHKYSAAVSRLFQKTAMAGAVEDWSRLIASVIEDFDAAISSWRNEYDTLMLSWHEAATKPHANAIRYQLACMYELTVIEALADRQFLPHYGFPIGVQKLRVIAPDEKWPNRVREEDQYRLERGSLMALREYVPGSQLLAGGKLVSSRGLLKHWTGANLDNYLGLRGKSCKCENGHFYYTTAGPIKNCPVCSGAPASSAGELLFPKHGFSGAAWDPPRWSTEVERVGHAETVTMTFAQEPPSESERQRLDDFAGIVGLRAEYRENGELLVYNSGEKSAGFAICLKCGYADSEVKYGHGTLDLPAWFDFHAPLTSTNKWDRCWKEGPVAPLRNQVLAAREITDVLLLDFSACLGPHGSDEALVTTLAYGLQRAGAQLLELDSRELGVLPVPAGEQGKSLGIVIYDNVPGGAGHVQELLKRGQEWLSLAEQLLFVSQEHDARCDTACLECLLSFEGQDVASRNLLQRRLALGVLRALLTGQALPPPDEPEEGQDQEVPVIPASDPSTRSADERRRAALERRRQ